ncbi:MAG: hypothetical protein KGL39_07425 [Patescibacteria group bacterium]|nr:hypothetical protein [Patescibacteria group bacterium]
MTEEQINHMVDRFLAWRLPQPWHPDNGISYQRPNYAHAPADHDWPTGANLFDADQATEMVRYLAQGIPGPDARLHRLKEKINLRLNNHLCAMEEGFDDSIVGLNEAWGIVRAVFAEILGDEE